MFCFEVENGKAGEVMPVAMHLFYMEIGAIPTWPESGVLTS